MSRPSPAQIRGIADFQNTYTWEVGFLRTPGALSGVISPFRFNLQCLSSELPKKVGQTSTIMMRGQQIFNPGIYSVSGQIRLTFLETVDAQVRDVIRLWEEACANKTGDFTALTGDLYLRTTDNQDRPNYEYLLLWAFFEDSDIQQLEGGNSEPMQPSITLRYTDYKSRKL